MSSERLTSWLDESRTTQSDLARRINVTRSAVTRWATGVAEPRVPLAIAIEKHSAGAVPATGWPGTTFSGTRGARAVAEWMSMHQFTFLDAAEFLGCSPRTVRSLLQHRREPHSETLVRLHAFGPRSMRALTLEDFARD